MSDYPKTEGENGAPYVEDHLDNYNSAILYAAGIILDAAEGGVRRPGIADTPRRFAKAFKEWFDGYSQNPAEILKTFEDGADDVDEMVLQRDIPVWSHCEHHVAPFFGVAHVAYIPKGKIVGLSKLSRLVDCFSHRLQVQERLTAQIAGALRDHVSVNVAVILSCRHTCMESRGVNRAGTSTVTSAMYGQFRNSVSLRQEMLHLVRP